jgi:hypothetical protein
MDSAVIYHLCCSDGRPATNTRKNVKKKKLSKKFQTQAAGKIVLIEVFLRLRRMRWSNYRLFRIIV